MSSNNSGFEFGDFNLTRDGRLQTRTGDSVSVTPKTIQVLQVLLRRPGEIVAKSELIDAVWPDSFVEEGNLKFTISLLRQALGDDVHSPRYIQTVPRLGYRFIATVTARQGETEMPVQRSPLAGAVAWEQPMRTHWPRRFALGAVILGVIVSGLWYSAGSTSRTAGTLLTTPFVSEKLLSGGVPAAAISADGNSVAYLLQQANKHGIWLRQMDTGTNVELVPATDDLFGTLAFSPDGTDLYFSRKRADSKIAFTIDRVSVKGGIPVTVVSGTDAAFSLSRDGRISYLRCSYQGAEECSLYVAAADERNEETKLVTRSHPLRIADNQISPDGKRIAFAAGHASTRGNEFGLYEVDIASRAERPLSSAKFFNIKRVRWLADGSTLLITAITNAENTIGIWSVSAANGSTERLTRDAVNYSGLSLDGENNSLVATVVSRDFQIALVDPGDPAARRTLVAAGEGRFGSDGRIYFSSMISGNADVWSVMTDGSGQRQLTNSPWEDVWPVPAPDSSFIAFASNGSGEQHVYRMNTDGTGRSRLTEQTGGVPMFVADDGQWIYYRSTADKTLWRVSSQGGQEAMVLNARSDRFAYSPPHGKVAFADGPGLKELSVVDLNSGNRERAFKLAGQSLAVGWASSQDAVMCAVRTTADRAELWRYPLDGSTGTFVVNLTDRGLVELSSSPDGRLLAVTEGEWRHDAVLIRGLR